MPKEPKGQKHHYVPFYYLKQWMGAKECISEFSRPYDRVATRSPHPDGTGYIRGLYAIDDPDANVVNAIEDMFLNRRDGIASDALRCLLREVPFPQPQRMRHAWTRFILSLLIRYPEAISEMKGSFGRIYRGSTSKPESRTNPRRSRNTKQKLGQTILPACMASS